MLTANDRLTPNTAEIAAEVIDGEAIIINLATGTYFSMDRTGGFVWSLVEANRSIAEIAEALTERYEVALARAEADLQQLAADLLHHNLVVVADGEPIRALTTDPSSSARDTYSPPMLTAYRDMGDLLALDPPAPGMAGIPWKPRDSPGE